MGRLANLNPFSSADGGGDHLPVDFKAQLLLVLALGGQTFSWFEQFWPIIER